MPRISDLTEHPVVYRVWQAPFASEKLAPVLARLDRSRRLRVLDVGCGPGTDAAHFREHDYLGIDLNARKIASATRRFGDRFMTADVTRLQREDLGRFDVVLINSLLHHLDDRSVAQLLAHLAKLLDRDGQLQVVELVLPAERSVARWLAHQDQGRYPRPLAAWRTLLTEAFTEVAFQPFAVRRASVTLWQFVHFHGRPK